MATGSVMMYSGAENPQRELTQEEIDTIENKCAELWAFNPTQLIHPQSGFSGYAVELNDKYVISDKRGFVSIYSGENVVCWHDEVGMFEYLNGILSGLIVGDHITSFSSEPKCEK